jgi:predicted glycoside hydrolase/deacetylase ChbG (UPF0249 family)
MQVVPITRLNTSAPQSRLASTGVVIVNADDWGRDALTTDRTHDCVRHGAVSSVSAMVFMEDSERAANIAREESIDAGLHLNLTTAFSKVANSELAERQQKIALYLRRHRLAPAVFHPGLVQSFDYVVAAQLDEYRRLFGNEPARIDGHHHMHLCANVFMGRLLPEGTVARRSFSFGAGEKSVANRAWRNVVNAILARRHRLTDFLFSLPPVTPGRLDSIFSLAAEWVVEIETHPVNSDEYSFLASGGLSKWSDVVQFSSFSGYFH